MADSYTKLFSDIVDSSIWTEDSDTCKVWITLLALCNNSDGYVRGSVGWLAGKAHVKPEVCEAALRKFSEPDPASRTPDNEGRRIEFLEDGWLILNYLIFRDRLSTNPKAIKTRQRVQKHRERYNALRNAFSVTRRYTDSVSVSAYESVQGKESAERKPKFIAPSLAEVRLAAAKTGLSQNEADKFHCFYESKGWKVGKEPMKKWPSALAGWKLRSQENHGKINSTANQGGNSRPVTPVRGSTAVGGF